VVRAAKKRAVFIHRKGRRNRKKDRSNSKQVVAKINSSKAISRALNYNEQKVKKGAALCLYAGNFFKEGSNLSFYEKLHHFQSLQKLNEGVKTNSVHISISFHPSEKISNETMERIWKRIHGENRIW
jgi:hypothetical protein